MRKFVWLTAFAAAALFFGATDNAFAHGNHHHVPQIQAQHAPALTLEVIEHAAEQTQHFGEVVSAAQPQPETCPHGQGANCDCCAACAGNASVAIAVSEVSGRELAYKRAVIVFSSPLVVRQAVLDLSRPPKPFA